MLGPQGRVVGALLAGVLVGITAWFWTGLFAAVPLAVAVGGAGVVLAGWPGSRPWLGEVARIAAVASLAATSLRFLPGDRFPSSAAVVGLIEVAGLVLLLVLVVRWLPSGRARTSGALSGFAVAAWILRIVPESTPLGFLGALASWSPVPVGAALAGLYGRRAADRRRRAVVEARRVQRLDLARDLHDFVAHEVTGIVVQAQAAQVAGGEDPRVAIDALRRIEQAGLQALGSMDRALQVLRVDADDDAVSDADVLPAPEGLSELPRVLERFAASGGPAVDAQVDNRLVEEVPAAVGALAHRVVVEGLTNVRRHAPGAARVTVRIDAGDAAERLVVSIVNDLPPAAGSALSRAPEAGGAGLAELAGLVRDLGGDLYAGAHEGGWRLAAWLPLSPGVREHDLRGADPDPDRRRPGEHPQRLPAGPRRPAGHDRRGGGGQR